MNKFTQTFIEHSVNASHTINSIEAVGFNNSHNDRFNIIGKWILENLYIKDIEKQKDFIAWMDVFVRDGAKIISIPFELAKSLIEANLPEDSKWNIETFGIASIIEITEHNYIFTSISADKNKQFVKSMSAAEIALNGALLFKAGEPELLVKRISYIFRNRPNGLIIEEKKSKQVSNKKHRASKKISKKSKILVEGTLYVIKEDKNLQAKYIKQLQEKEAQKEKNKSEARKRQFRSWRRGHFRKQPVGLRADKQYELRWIMGHWMGSMDLPIKIQADKIRYVDIPPQQPRYKF